MQIAETPSAYATGMRASVNGGGGGIIGFPVLQSGRKLSNADSTVKVKYVLDNMWERTCKGFDLLGRIRVNSFVFC